MITSNIASRPKVLCFVDYYLPGFKAGGPLRTIENMVLHLGEEFEFLIVTRDRDFLDIVPYDNILINQWNDFGKAKVFYASNSICSVRGVINLLEKTSHDILYLNSFFSSKMTLLPLSVRYFRRNYKKPIILAPRGEFSAGALQLKKIKKKIYIVLANKLSRIYSNLVWQASSLIELEDIKRAMPNIVSSSSIVVAPDLLPPPVKLEISDEKINNRLAGPLRIIFLSRISPKKNLDFLIKVLSEVNVDVALTIYGPVEDSVYWAYCQSLIKKLPLNITVMYKGGVPHEQVSKIFSTNDFFIFPTRGENFGHVIYESLAAGTAVIISDQTPWRGDKQGAVVVLSLNNLNAWKSAINKTALLSNQNYHNLREAAINYALNHVQASKSVEQNRNLFLFALKQTICD